MRRGMMTALAVAVIVAAAVILDAAILRLSAPSVPEAGIVTAKATDPGETWYSGWKLGPLTWGEKRGGGPERYWLKISDGTATGWVEVGAERYDSVRIGDSVTRSMLR